jgi:hypothetical protein
MDSLPPDDAADPDYVTLVSSDGCEFVLATRAARRSGFVARILAAQRLQPLEDASWSGARARAQQQVPQPSGLARGPSCVKLPLPDVHSSVLDVVCHFLSEADAHADARRGPLDVSRALAFLDPASAEDCAFVSELLVAADFLSC